MGRHVDGVAVGLGDESRDRSTSHPDRCVDEGARPTIDREVAFSDLEMVRIRFEADGPAKGELVQEPEAVEGPETPQFDHHRRSIGRRGFGQSIHDRCKDNFLLRFMDPSKTPDDLGGQDAVVAALLDEYTVVHDLDGSTGMIDHLTRMGNSGEFIGISAGDCERHPRSVLERDLGEVGRQTVGSWRPGAEA